MNLIIEGKTYKIKLNRKKKGGSTLHKEAYRILQKLFPYDTIHQEVFLPKVKLYVDLLIEKRGLCIETNGPQHYQFIEHFHSSKLNFLKAQARDRKKREILENNGFLLISLRYDEQDSWEQTIKEIYGNGGNESGTTEQSSGRL